MDANANRCAGTRGDAHPATCSRPTCHNQRRYLEGCAQIEGTGNGRVESLNWLQMKNSSHREARISRAPYPPASVAPRTHAESESDGH